MLLPRHWPILLACLAVAAACQPARPPASATPSGGAAAVPGEAPDLSAPEPSAGMPDAHEELLDGIPQPGSAALDLLPIIMGEPDLVDAIGAPPRDIGSDGYANFNKLPLIAVRDSWTHELAGTWVEPFKATYPYVFEELTKVSGPAPVVYRAYLPQSNAGAGAPPRTLVLEAIENMVIGTELRLFLHDAAGWHRFGLLERGIYVPSAIVAYERQGSRLRVSPPDMPPVWLDFDQLPDLDLQAWTLEAGLQNASELWPLSGPRDGFGEDFLTVRMAPDDAAPVLLDATRASAEAYVNARGLRSEGINLEVVPAGPAQGDWVPVEALIYLDGGNQYCPGEHDTPAVRVPGWLRFRKPDGTHLVSHMSISC